jgi:hypothetical protein
VTALVTAVVVALVTFARHREAEPERPWWQHSSVWIGASAVFALLGVFVAPKLLGFTFIFLPFLWVGGGRRERQQPNHRDADA